MTYYGICVLTQRSDSGCKPYTKKENSKNGYLSKVRYWIVFFNGMTVFHLGLTYTKDILLYSSNLYSVVPLEGLQERPKPSPVHDESLTDESS